MSKYKIVFPASGEEKLDVVEIDGKEYAVPSEAYKKELLRPRKTSLFAMNQPIWRYMSLTKFISILKNSKLWIPRFDTVGDPLEGSFTSTVTFKGREPYKDLSEERIERLEASYSKLRHDRNNLFYISCWHANENENRSLWATYGGTTESVAIQTTVEELMYSLERKELEIESREFIPVMTIGDVQYIDFEKTHIPENECSLWYKSIEYRDDAEIRALIELWSLGWRHQGTTPPGLSFYIPLSSIKQVVVSPKCSEVFLEVVSSVCEKYGLDITVKRSKLDRKPIF